MSLLNQVQKGRKLKPLALLLHAPHGIGKSTFATEAPSPIYVGNEENDELDVPRFPKVEKWEDLEKQLETLKTEKHDYKTLVIDTVDGLEQIAQNHILNLKGAENKTMATAFGGYGKAYEKMANMFLDIKTKYLIPLRDETGINIVLLVHSKKVKFEDTMLNISYDHYETNLHSKTKAIFEDWVSAILFANYYLVRAENNSGKEYAEGVDGLRMIYTEERPSHVAKNRFELPYEIEFNKTGTWKVIKDYIIKHFSVAKQKSETKGEIFCPEAKELKEKIQENLVKMPKDLQAGINISVSRATGDVKELKRILTKMEGALA